MGDHNDTDQAFGGGIHLFPFATNVSLIDTTINIVGGDTVQNTYHGVPNDDRIDSLKHEVAHWLSSITYRTIQHDTLSKHTPGTGWWFLSSSTFNTWLAKSDCILWVTGMPGAGKTVLTSIVVDHLQRLALQGHDIAVLYAYFRYSDRHTTSDILASLIKQLVEFCTYLPPEVVTTYRHHLKAQNQLSEDEMLDLFRQLSPAFGKIFIILDALDEVLEQLRSSLLRRLVVLPIHLLVTSRPIDVSLSLESTRKLTKCSIGTLTEKDIETFVTSSIRKNLHLRRVLEGDDSLLKTICGRVIQASNGMFLAASLHIEALNACTTRNEVRHAAECLPSDLDNMFISTLQRIQNQGAQRASLAMRAILWLTYARRPLRTIELQHALAIENEENSFDVDNVARPEIIFSACAGLVIQDKLGMTVRLIHYTAYDFFRRNHAGLFTRPHSFMARNCITYLSAFKFHTSGIQTDKELQKFLDVGPLLQYAYDNWGHHAHDCLEEGTLPTSIISFVLGCKSYPLQRFSLIWFEKSAIEVFNSCHVAAYYGLTDILKLVPESFSNTSSHKKTPLVIASEEGRADAVKFLLSRPNVNLNWKDEFGTTLLILACREGHSSDVIQLLLSSKSVKVNARNTFGETALICASRCGREDIVQALISHERIELKLQGGPALFEAVQQGYKSVIRRLLLQNDVNVNYESEVKVPYSTADPCHKFLRLVTPKSKKKLRLLAESLMPMVTPLIMACLRGDEAAVRLLLSRKDIDLRWQGGTVLFFASMEGHEKLVRLLLSHPGLDLRSAGGPAIIVAAQRGHISVVQLLLTHGDALNLSELGTSILVLAANLGHTEYVQTLLSRSDVDVNAAGAFPVFWGFSHTTATVDTALIQACKEGHKEIVRMLLAHENIEVNGQWLNWTPLITASEKGHLPIVSLLLSHPDMDVNMQSQGATPLLAAAKNGHISIVKELLKHSDTDINMESQACTTALIASYKSGNFQIAQLLLSRSDIDLRGQGVRALVELSSSRRDISKAVAELLVTSLPQGVNINVHHENRTALVEAAKNGHKALVKALLCRPEVDVNVEDENTTALIASCERGHMEIFEMLWSRSDIHLRGHALRVLVGLTSNTCDISAGTLNFLMANLPPNVNINTSYGGRIALIEASKNSHKAIVERLLSFPSIDINTEDGETTALIASCGTGHLDIAELLLSRNEIDLRRQGMRALVELCSQPQCNDRCRILEYRLANLPIEVDVMEKHQGRIALVEASKNGHEVVVQMLLARPGIDVNQRDGSRYRETALLAACRKQHLAIVELLLPHADADFTIKNNEWGRFFIQVYKQVTSAGSYKLRNQSMQVGDRMGMELTGTDQLDSRQQSSPPEYSPFQLFE
ncbi:hypothetical protein CVT26_001113 [Gymnopilus dilepis]|uniref:NACHT domain-containing protein n=1 Tax=Gymnopilus dilepis TaxID=231916 RepID=A0A409W7W4_9AGAR|nr:hypothetical protein CVT26_001113 [Gymnopilus dilepis]